MLRTLTIIFLAFASSSMAGEPMRIIDGDGLKAGKERIRLWGIDAPERRQPCTKDGAEYPCGAVAADMLAAFIGSNPVACVEVDQDRYGRTVARCEVEGADLGALMVASGWAVDYERYSGGFYAEHMAQARAAGRGMWAGAFINPWDWRKERK